MMPSEHENDLDPQLCDYKVNVILGVCAMPQKCKQNKELESKAVMCA